MNVASLCHDLYEFAVELRKLAYTTPGGHQDPLVRLGERVIRCASRAAWERGGALPCTTPVGDWQQSEK